MTRTIVVTGSNSGIGKATAALLRERGARVIGLDAKGDGAEVDEFHRFDLTDPDSIDAALSAIDESLHGLVNVAGLPGSHDGEAVMRVNVLGLRHVTESLLGRLQPASAVVQVASDAGHAWRERLGLIRDLLRQRTYAAGLAWVREHPMSGPDAYDFSKEVVIVYAMAGSMLARPHGLRSLSVSPGAVETPLLKHFYDTMGADLLDRLKAQSGARNAEPEDVARVIAFALSEDAAWINGSDIVVDGGAGPSFHFGLTDVDADASAEAFFGA